jgi:hypothetical protein
MKKTLFLLALFILVSAAFAAAEAPQRFSLGLAIEGNMNTRRNAAMGEHLSFDYNFTNIFAGGIKLGFSHNFDRIKVVESEAFFRWYFFDLPEIRFFAQADLGASVIMEEVPEDIRVRPAVMGGFSGGVRFLLGNWYLEPFIRGGYPFVWGAGLSAGYRF